LLLCMEEVLFKERPAQVLLLPFLHPGRSDRGDLDNLKSR